MSKLHLILAFHNHQPVGNFEHVLEECYRKSYLPFLETLREHPRLKVVLHYSGHLLDWMQGRHPEAVEIIRDMISAERVEMLSGGFYEPIISILPEKDRIRQITEFSRYIRKNLGQTPRGMWLAERVWEPQMPGFIARAGMDYLPIDDYHFKLCGLQDSDLLGYYLTEDQGSSIAVFPGSERLRYMIPFGRVDDIISYFREIHLRGGDPLLTMADDGEKFGVWPDTFKHCYEDLWIEEFFSALDQADWIETTTFSSYRDRFRPLGRVYLPTASYREMGQWALPSEKGLEYDFVTEELRKVVGERSRELIRGGIWRSFLVKYPEANHLQKRMFAVSPRVHEAARKEPSRGGAMIDDLWKSQCNDAYWHGIFGGLYLPHLRAALYRHMLRAESAADAVLKGLPRVQRGDFDSDGYDDILAANRHMSLAVSERSGSMTELSLYREAVNVCDTLSRRPEAYHAKVAQLAGSGAGAPRTIHDQVSVKEAGLARYLVYDDYRRASLIDHFLPEGTDVEDMMRAAHEEAGDFVGGVYEMKHSLRAGTVSVSLSRRGRAGQSGMLVGKTVLLPRQRAVSVDYGIEGRFEGLFAVELNLSLLGSPLVTVRSPRHSTTVRHVEVHERIRRFSVEDHYLGLAMEFSLGQESDLWQYPVETVSLSEQGIERLYQGTAFLLVARGGIEGSRKFSFIVNFREDRKR